MVKGIEFVGKEGIRVYNIDDMPIVDIKKVKIFGKIRGEKKDIELSMSKKIFSDWIEKLRKSGGQGNGN